MQSQGTYTRQRDKNMIDVLYKVAMARCALEGESGMATDLLSPG
jgi:hypothetical protein